MKLPPLFPPVLPAPPPTVLLMSSAVPTPEEHAATFLKDSAKPTYKPSRMGTDVWTLLQEYTKQGGLLDLAEEIASLAQQEQEVRESELPLSERIKLLTNLAKERARVKVNYLKVQEARKNYITFDQFVVFLDDLYGTLLKYINDPTLLKAIGSELGVAAERLKQRMQSG